MTPKTASRTIVVGYDGSAAALAAVEQVDRPGRAGGPPPSIVHATSVSARLHRRGLITASMVNDASDFAESWCWTGSSVTASASPRSRTSATSPSEPPAPAIVGAAEYPMTPTRSSSAAVVRPRPLSPLGSVAHDVIHRAQCPGHRDPRRGMVERPPEDAAGGGRRRELNGSVRRRPRSAPVGGNHDKPLAIRQVLQRRRPPPAAAATGGLQQQHGLPVDAAQEAAAGEAVERSVHSPAPALHVTFTCRRTRAAPSRVP